MSEKCHFTGQKAKRSCPGAVPGRTVPISGHACMTHMIYDVPCPLECRHLDGNLEWLVDKTAQRMRTRMNEEPWLARLLDAGGILDVFIEMERRLALAARTHGVSGDDETARALGDLLAASRAKKSGLVIAGAAFEVSTSGPLFHQLAVTLDFYRTSFFTDKDSLPAMTVNILHRLTMGRDQLARINQKTDTPRLGAFSPAMLKQLQERVPSDPEVEGHIQEALDVMQRSLDHRRSRGGYVAYLMQFY